MGICIVSGNIEERRWVCKVLVNWWCRSRSCCLVGLPPRVSRLIERAGIRPQSLSWLIRELDWLGGRWRMRALHGEKTRLGTRWSEGSLGDYWWWFWSGRVGELRISWWRSCAVWLCVVEVVCWFHEEAIAWLPRSRPWYRSSRWCWRRGWRASSWSIFVLCETASFRAVDIAISLPVTGKAECWWPFHIESHCVCGWRLLKLVVGSRKWTESVEYRGIGKDFFDGGLGLLKRSFSRVVTEVILQPITKCVNIIITRLLLDVQVGWPIGR